MKKSSGYIPELDGVRGLAIILVVIFHAFMLAVVPMKGLIPTLASYGFAGVDLFFVLSGCLITGILLEAKDRPDYFKKFYAKRALRIWPLYYLLIGVTFVAIPFIAARAQLEMGDLSVLKSHSVWVYVLLLQNIYYPVGGPTLLLMTWSLAIEEQFYLIWPWLVLLFNRKCLVWIVAGVLMLSPLTRFVAQQRGVGVSRIYFMTWYRLDGLAFGALIALYRASSFYEARLTWMAALVALGIGAPASFYLLSADPPSFVALRFSMLALASAGLVTFAIWCYDTRSRLGQPLRAAWLRYTGRVSYCLYLVHQPIYYILGGRYARHVVNGRVGPAIAIMFLGFAISLVVATVSWFGFESQILKLKSRLHEQAPTLAAVEGWR